MYVRNEHLAAATDDVLYHLGLARSTHDLPAMFGDVKFVLTGGSARRMTVMAAMCAEQLPGRPTVGDNLCSTDRFAMYKHGMGMASMSIMFNELLKLLHYAHCADVHVFRVGTSGGLGSHTSIYRWHAGLAPGTVVVSTAGVNEAAVPVYEYSVLGVVRREETTFDADFVRDIAALGVHFDFPVTSGLTMGTSDFYEGQGRLDGAFCDYGAPEKFAFLRRVHAAGVRNIEMEAPAFAAYMRRAGISKAADVCVTLIDRLDGDQITATTTTLKEYEQRSARLVIRHIVDHLNRNDEA